MMLAAKLPFYLWAEVIAMAVYLINRLSTSALNGKILYEGVYGEKSDLSYIRVFGVVAYWIDEG